ncbi:outer membrane beta-barrel protein [Aliagarivorans marinus]|uniref:outer membrane beta-barrel protein n=1 Tax=Aliagarivorans marinus TaxID=561965 RepID=UPI00146FA53C|nr:outer membrane beta-barrel protein [Aliagarivorans marinus]
MIVSLIATSSSALAKLQPQPYITQSGLEVTPFLSLGYRYNDNITQSGEQLEGSDIVSFKPELNIHAERGANRYQAYYRIDVAEYLQSSIDDYVDHRAGVSAQLIPAERHSVNVDYRFRYLHEDRGSGLSEGIGEQLTQLLYVRSNDLGLLYAYGGEQSRGGLEFKLGWGDKVYTRLEQLSRYRNWQERRFASKFLYRAHPAAQLFVQWRLAQRRYQHLAATQESRDNDNHYLFFGVSWEVSGSTSGEIKLGYEDKQFDSQRKGYNGFSWEASLNYLPRDHSKLTLTTSQTAEDPDQSGDFVEQMLYRVEWQHYWRDRLMSRLSYSYLDQQYSGVERDDQRDRVVLSLSYQLRRWLLISSGWRWEDKQSSRAGIGYTQNQYFLSINGTL